MSDKNGLSKRAYFQFQITTMYIYINGVTVYSKNVNNNGSFSLETE